MSRYSTQMAIAVLAAGILVSPSEAGCLKGAAVGAVAGHFAHHHAVLGAIAGCAVGHHLAVKAREQKAAQAHAQPVAKPHP